MKVSRSMKRLNVAEKLRSFRRKGSGTGGEGGSTGRMGIRRSSTKLIAMVKKNIMRPKFRRHNHNNNNNKAGSENIIIIHNNTSITSNDEDNRSNCIELKEIASLKEEDVTSSDSEPPTSFDSLLLPPDEDQPSTKEEEYHDEDDDDDDFIPGIIKLREEKASIHIQCVFKAHWARRALRVLKSLVKLQAVVRGACVRRQARMALHCMNTLDRLQVKVRARQIHCRPSNAVAAS